MARPLVIAGFSGLVLAGGALAIASKMTARRPSDAASIRPAAHVAAPRRPLEETEERSRQPGVHRAGPAELAVRNRVAQAESAALVRRARLRAQGIQPQARSVAATAWVSLGPTDALNEFNS